MEGGRSVRCKLCPQILSETTVATHFQRVHDHEFGRVVLWKCGVCGLQAIHREQQMQHDEGVKMKTLACGRRARLNEQFFQKIGPISHSRRVPSNSLDLSRPLPDSLPKYFQALQLVKQNTLASQSVDEEEPMDTLVVPHQDEGRPCSAPPPKMDDIDEAMPGHASMRRFNYSSAQRGQVNESHRNPTSAVNTDERDTDMSEQ